MKKIFQLTVFLMISGLTGVNAQVRIGSDENPHDGSVLDLTNSKNLGLKLPLVSLQDAASLQLGGSAAGEDRTAAGMLVYNTNAYALDGKGIYVWDGRGWYGIHTAGKETLVMATCDPDYYIPKTGSAYQVSIPVPANTTNIGGQTIDHLTFLTYNLGANPDFTPKQQMAYQSTYTGGTYQDITVHGGFYQWGRKDAAHSFRCNHIAPSAGNDFFLAKNTCYGANGVNASAYNPATDTKFVWGDGLTSSNSGDWNKPHEAASHFWGNGGGLATQTVALTGSDNTNNPCPAGFRVPTQHEWAILIGNNATNDSNSTVNDSFDVATAMTGVIKDGEGCTTERNPKITWVPVVDGKASTAFKSGTDYGNSNYSAIAGYAVYKASDWTSADLNYKNGTWELYDKDGRTAPEPLMFLPAAGGRIYDSSGQVYETGATGCYWSSTVNGHDGLLMLLNDSYVNVSFAFDRALGCSVRCISEY